MPFFRILLVLGNGFSDKTASTSVSSGPWSKLLLSEPLLRFEADITAAKVGCSQAYIVWTIPVWHMPNSYPLENIWD